jgi:membrane-bound ClpP family serine protease
LVGGAILAELVEKAFWLRWTKRGRPVVGREALVGLPAEVLAACQPDGAVRLRGERWKAHCSEGARVGDTVLVEAVEQLTLVVSQPESGSDQNHPHPGRRQHEQLRAPVRRTSLP